jgi:hypothetical protein
MTSNKSIEINKIDFLHDEIKININDSTIKENKKSDEKITQNQIINNPAQIDPMFSLVKDITFNLILNIPGLRNKLDNILNDPNLAILEISKIFDEIQTKIQPEEMNKLRLYFSSDHTRNSLSGILQTAFVNIMADGKIDMNDAPHFMTLIFDIITLFNQHTSDSNNQIEITGEAVMFFLYFIIKCILVLTLDGQEETTAVNLLDTSFKLISVAVLPIMKIKCCCNPFSCFKKNKNKK